MDACLLSILFSVVAIASVSTFCRSAHDGDKIFYAVSPSNGSEKFYLKIKQMGKFNVDEVVYTQSILYSTVVLFVSFI